MSIQANDLGLNLATGRERDLFRWFLACLLFGKPIQQEIARAAYEELVKEGMDRPDAIENAGWKRPVAVLDRAHYVRYDESTAMKLLDVMRELRERYDGSVRNMVEMAKDEDDLKRRLEAFTGVGPKTAEIFLRDVRPLRYAHARP